MEYILNVRRIVPLTDEEKEKRNRDRNYRDPSYLGAFGQSPNTETIEVLSVVLSEEEYNRAKHSIIESKK